jgi:hypothetical protein
MTEKMAKRSGKACELEMLAADIGDAIVAYVAKELRPLRERIEQLEAGGLKYVGVYQPAQAYARGSVCTFDGSGFVALRDTINEKPGSSDAWQLAIKRGRDGKDAR